MRKVLASLVSMLLALNTGVSFSYAAKTPTPRRTHRPITEFKTYTQEELANMSPRRYNSYSALESNMHSSSLATANSSFKSASKSESKCHNNVKEKHWSARCPTAKPVIVASKQFDRPQPTKVPSATATVVPTTAVPKKTPVATTAAATKSRTPQPTITATVAPSTPNPKPTVAPSTPAPKAEEQAGAKGSTMQEEEVPAEGAKGGEEAAEGNKGAEEVVESKGGSDEVLIPEEIIPEEVAKKHPAAQTGERETAEEKKAREEEEFKEAEEKNRRINGLVEAGFPNMAKLVNRREVRTSIKVDTGVNGCPKLLIEPGTEKAIEEIKALGMPEDVVDFCKNNSLCADETSAKLGNSTSECDQINAVAAIPVNYGTFCHDSGRGYVCNENSAYNEKVETFLKDASKRKAAEASNSTVVEEKSSSKGTGTTSNANEEVVRSQINEIYENKTCMVPVMKYATHIAGCKFAEPGRWTADLRQKALVCLGDRALMNQTIADGVDGLHKKCSTIVEVTNNSTATENVTAAEDPVVVQVVENNITPPVENVSISENVTTVEENVTSVEEPVVTVKKELSQQQIDEAMEATRKRLGIVDTPEVVVKDVSLPSDIPENYGGVTVDEEAVKRQIEEEAMEAARNRVSSKNNETQDISEPEEKEDDTSIIESIVSSVKSAGRSAISSVKSAPGSVINFLKTEGMTQEERDARDEELRVKIYKQKGPKPEYWKPPTPSELIRDTIVNSDLVIKHEDQIKEVAENFKDSFFSLASATCNVLRTAKNTFMLTVDVVDTLTDPITEPITNAVKSAGKAVSDYFTIDNSERPFSLPMPQPGPTPVPLVRVIETGKIENETVQEENVSVVIPEDPVNKSVDIPEVNISPEVIITQEPEETVVKEPIVETPVVKNPADDSYGGVMDTGVAFVGAQRFWRY